MNDLEKGVAAYQENDFDTAISLLTPLAESGDPEAQFNLALVYDNGEGVFQNYKEAVRLYRLCAEQGSADAQTNMGRMYSQGHGVLQDYVLAHMWFNLAASNGHETAIKNRDIMASLMTASQIEKAQDLARECVAKDCKGC